MTVLDVADILISSDMLLSFVTLRGLKREEYALHQRLRGIRSADGVNPVLADKSPAALTGHAKSPLIRGLISD
uniref:Uncharacterized protein n=1 Tax=Vespula pensylvanica TaxID=30213 RepID=A0A834PGN8_VESPE|nr:hypothetical protein H0235_001242 [Vespula pensylvanica]